MRRCIVSALLFAAVLVPVLHAGDSDGNSRPMRRLFGKAEKSQPIQVVVMKTNEFEALPPAAIAPSYPTPFAHTPYLDLTEPSASPHFVPPCPGGLLAGRIDLLERPRQSLDCIGCSSLRCEWRFILGGCRAFFNEGPFRPTFPDNCPCGNR